MTYLILLALAFFSLLAIIRLDWALFIILLSLPSYLIRFQLGPIPSTMLEMMILIVFFVWFVKNKTWQRWNKKSWKIRTKKYPYHLEIIGILIAAWIALAVSGFSNSGLGVFKAYFLEPIMLYIVIINNSQGNYRKYIWPLSLSALFISSIAIFQQLTGAFIFNEFWANLATRRVTSVFSYPNAVGLYLAPIIFLSISLFWGYPKKSSLVVALKKMLILLSIISSIAAIIFARSEGALIAILGASFVFALLLNKRSRIIAITVSILAIFLISLSPNNWQYLKDKATLMDLSGQIRRQQWKETMLMLQDGKLITGAGLNNYQTAIEPFHQEGIFVKNHDPEWHRHVVWNEEYRKKMWQPVEIYLYPHNIFLNFWTELGLLGLCLFFFLISRYLYDALKILKKDKQKERVFSLGLIAAMSTVLIHGLVDVPYFKNDLAIIFWLLIAFLGIMKLKLQTKKI
ncbi:MAG: O-antigen ligase family protein [Patescibacteria group bacterium]|jgi:O-antigen ligase|nr:O-antigen ligase family protein [Patescibacteria group bacterium]